MIVELWLSVSTHILVYFTYVVRGNVYSDDGRRFKCPLDPLTDRYPDPTDPTCVNYFLCHLGHAFPRKCGVRTAFHPKLKECFPRYQVPEDICALPVDCEYNGYMADPDDCTKYYICFFHQAIHYSCLTNFYFDPKKSLCVKDKKKSNECSKPLPMPGPSPKKPVFQRTRYVKPVPKTEPESSVPNSPKKTSQPDYGQSQSLPGYDSIRDPDLTTTQTETVDFDDEMTEQFPKSKRNTDADLSTTEEVQTQNTTPLSGS